MPLIKTVSEQQPALARQRAKYELSDGSATLEKTLVLNEW
jgi:hypothetical protein